MLVRKRSFLAWSENLLESDRFLHIGLKLSMTRDPSDPLFFRARAGAPPQVSHFQLMDDTMKRAMVRGVKRINVTLDLNREMKHFLKIKKFFLQTLDIFFLDKDHLIDILYLPLRLIIEQTSLEEPYIFTVVTYIVHLDHLFDGIL